MVLASMRKGVMSFIFMALLVVGGLGLVLSDAGGFFRNGGVSRTDVAKIGSEKISAIQFDRQIRRLLQGQQTTAQEAYKAGLITQYLQTEIAKNLIAREAKAYGIVIADATIAAEIKNFIDQTPIPSVNPKDALKILLQQKGLTEAEFVSQLRNEVSSQILIRAVSGLAATETPIPTMISQTLYKWFSMARDIDYVELSLADQAEPAVPDDKILAAYYDDIKDEYAIPETRNFVVGIFSPKNFPEKNDDQIFETINQIDDRIAGGETLDALKDEYKMTTTPVENLTATDLPEALMFLGKDAERLKSIAFETAEGDTAHLTELSNGDMAAVYISKINAASFEPLDKVKDKVIASWKVKAKKDAVTAQAQKIIDEINQNKKSLKDASGKIVTRQEGITRTAQSDVFTMLDIQKIMEPKIRQAILLSGAHGVQIIVPVADKIPAKAASPNELEQIGKAMKMDMSQEIQDEFLASLQEKYKVRVNTNLLETMYGGSANNEQAE